MPMSYSNTTSQPDDRIDESGGRSGANGGFSNLISRDDGSHCCEWTNDMMEGRDDVDLDCHGMEHESSSSFHDSFHQQGVVVAHDPFGTASRSPLNDCHMDPSTTTPATRKRSMSSSPTSTMMMDMNFTSNANTSDNCSIMSMDLTLEDRGASKRQRL